MKDKQRRKLKQ